MASKKASEFQPRNKHEKKIWDCLKKARRPLSAREIAERTGLPVTAMHIYLNAAFLKRMCVDRLMYKEGGRLVVRFKYNPHGVVNPLTEEQVQFMRGWAKESMDLARQVRNFVRRHSEPL